MSTTYRGWVCALVLCVAGLLCLSPAQTMAQTAEPPSGELEGDGTEVPSAANPPGYIGELLKAGDLQQTQVDQMRASGWGWGEIRLATLLARQMVLNSNNMVLFGDALQQVMDARAAGKGFGQIAADNSLKIGKLVRTPKAGGTAKGPTAQAGTTAQASEVEGNEEVSPDPTNPPAFITKLEQDQVVTQEQVNAMLTSGYGWGEVRIAALLAQRIAANSNGTLTFEAALAQVQAARAAGKDFGQIAADNNLKIGELVRNPKAGDAAPANAKKPGFLSRVGRFFGMGRSADRPGKTASIDKPERPERLERTAKPERVERPSRPEKPEKGPHK